MPGRKRAVYQRTKTSGKTTEVKRKIEEEMVRLGVPREEAEKTVAGFTKERIVGISSGLDSEEKAIIKIAETRAKTWKTEVRLREGELKAKGIEIKKGRYNSEQIREIKEQVLQNIIQKGVLPEFAEVRVKNLDPGLINAFNTREKAIKALSEGLSKGHEADAKNKKEMIQKVKDKLK